MLINISTDKSHIITICSILLGSFLQILCKLQNNFRIISVKAKQKETLGNHHILFFLKRNINEVLYLAIV